MIRKLISVAACVAAMLGAPAAFAAASSAVTELDVAALTASLSSQSLSFGGWTYRSLSDADNGGSFSQTVSPTAFSDADVPGVAALTTLGHAQANSSGGKAVATMDLISDFSLAAGAHLSFYVPYSITLHTGQLADVNSGNVFFEVKNTFNNSVVYNQDITFGTGDLQYHVVGSTDGQANSILVDFYNGTGATANYTFFGHINATSNAVYAPAVPEPETYAMLLAGMAVLGVMARRRIS
jgi:hypothetical protein